ncbi:YtxH domain-containing protein [Evansella clarkii]|jgi:gas vesicle protein|uniref:YtxH domain-containing protein n=1 Tax=Evansella clarkii TaxID=79879 RepID=UPI000998BCB3|nr:YtxH domain-containing protein [Evansella clarkii]
MGKNGNSMDTKDFLIGAIIGGVIGATSAMLLAPKSGRELRENINEKALTAKGKTVEFKNTAVEKSNEYTQLAKDKSSELSRAAKEQFSRVKGDYKSVADKAANMGSELTEDIKNIMETEKDAGRELAEKVVAEIEDTSQKLRSDIEQYSNQAGSQGTEDTKVESESGKDTANTNNQ